MKPNTSALGEGGYSSWLFATEYREWYTRMLDAVKEATRHNESRQK
jgi:hypothetical protein